MQNQVRVGIGVLIVKDDLLLMHQRISNHGNGQWCGPGGHLEYGESFEGCAKRETREEAGIEITNLRLLTLSNLKFDSGKQYVDICFLADWESGEPTIMEPEKNAGWKWFPLNEIPSESQLFGGEKYAIDTYLSGKFPVYKDSD